MAPQLKGDGKGIARVSLAGSDTMSSSEPNRTYFQVADRENLGTTRHDEKPTGGWKSTTVISVGLTLTLFFLLSARLYSGFPGVPVANLRSEAPEVAPISPHVYKHWEYLHCSGGPCFGKVTELDKTLYREEIMQNDLTRQKIEEMAARTLTITNSIGGDDKGKLQRDAKLLSMLDAEYLHEYSRSVMTVEEHEHQISTEIDYDNTYGFIQDCISVKFDDMSAPVRVVLYSTLRRANPKSDPTIATYVRNVMTDPEIAIDHSFVELAMNFMRSDEITSEMKARQGKFEVFTIDGNYHNIARDPLYRFYTDRTEKNVAGHTYKDYAYGQVPTPSDLPGYRGDGVAFRCPAVMPVKSNVTWVPLYQYYDGANHQVSTNPQDGVNHLPMTVLCFIATSGQGEADLIPVYKTTDTKFHTPLVSTSYPSGNPWAGPVLLGYAYAE
jgi:hypothetical protein